MLLGVARAPMPKQDRVAREFGDAVRPGSQSVDVLRLAAETLQAAVPADYWCGVLLDPSTLLDTGGLFTHSFPQDVMPRLFEIEHVEHVGADNLRALARRGNTVSVLSESTRGEIDADVYYQDILRPLGMADEMRVLLRHGPHAWGLLVWCRGGSTGFAPQDVATARALSTPAVNALRATLLTSGADAGDLPDAPGMLIIDAEGEPVSVSPTAQRWLDALQEDHPLQRALPNSVRALGLSAAAASIDRPARSRALTRTGRWASMHGWVADTNQIVVAIGPAGMSELIAIILDAYNLTAREREVTQQVMRGSSNTQIAAALSLSPYTVQDHLRAIFRKVEVSSARELMSAIFGRHYLPQLEPGNTPPLSTDGRLHENPGGRPHRPSGVEPIAV